MYGKRFEAWLAPLSQLGPPAGVVAWADPFCAFQLLPALPRSLPVSASVLLFLYVSLQAEQGNDMGSASTIPPAALFFFSLPRHPLFFLQLS